MKHKITTVGQPCLKCKTPVEKKNRPNMKTKPGQEYYFLYWFCCPKCKAVYHVEDAKVYCDDVDYPTKGSRKSERCQCRELKPLFGIPVETVDGGLNGFSVVKLMYCVDCKSVKYGG